MVRQVSWKKGSTPLTIGTEPFFNDDRITVRHEPRDGSWDLVIRHAQVTDSGMYECQVASQRRHLRHHVLLTVTDRKVPTTVRPRPDIRISGSPYVERSERIYLSCNATGLEQAPQGLDWFLNGNKLNNKHDPRVTIRKHMSITSRTIVSTLTISDADLRDSGTYVCRTSNLQIQDIRVNVLNAGKSSVRRNKEDEPTYQVQGQEGRQGTSGASGIPGRDVTMPLPLAFISVLIPLTFYRLFPS